MPEAGFELYKLSTHVSCNSRAEFEVKSVEATALNSGIRYDCDEIGPQGTRDDSPQSSKEERMNGSGKQEGGRPEL